MKLKDLVSDFIVPMRNKPKKFGGNIPWCKIDDINGKYLFNTTSDNYVTDEEVESMNLKIYPLNTVLFTCSASIGETAITKSKLCTNQTFIGLVTNDKLNYEYLYYYLGVVAPQIQKIASVTTIPYISRSLFENLELDFIDINSQNKVVKILSDFDAKIELNNKINAELESMAKLIYDYWFVQFDFPDENGKPYKSSGGKMVYNQELKREIPDGWEVKELGDYAAIKKGKLITQKTANTDGNIKVVSAGIDFSHFHSESNYEANTITISASGANAGFINFWREPIFANDCTTVRGNSLADTLQLLGFLQMRQDYIYTQARGSAQPHVYPKDIEGLKIAIPNSEVIKQYGLLVDNSNIKISNNLKENEELVKLRDWLLPMLMNGQVKVG